MGSLNQTLRTARHETALRYAAAGIPVFPCRVSGKEPATPAGFKDATTDVGQINAWWAEADYNVAVEPERAGWCVVDLDPKNGGMDAWKALDGEKPDTYTVATPSGGRHLYYSGSLTASASKLARGVDTRGRGSYVLVPPSVVDGNAYLVVDDRDPAPLPAWIAASAGQQRARAEAPTDITLDQPDNVARARARLHNLVSAGDVAVEGEGGNDRTYRLAAELINVGCSAAMAADLMLDHWNQHCEPPWDDDDLRTIVDHAWAYKQNPAGSWGVSQGIPQAWRDFAATLPAPEPSKMPSFRAWPTLREQHFDPPQWVWKDRLLMGEPNLYTGDAGVGKTTLAENIAVAVATGTPLLDQVTMAMPVALLVAEDHYGPIRDNIAAIAQEFGVTDHAGLAQVHVLSVKTDKVPGGHILARIDDEGHIEGEGSAFLRECIVPFLQSIPGPKLWVVDPLDALVMFNRLSDHSARALATDFFGALCSALNTTILVNDHPSRAGIKSGDHYSGSVQLKAAFSLFATLLAEEWTGTVAKQRRMKFQVIKGRYAGEETDEFFRTSRSPAFTKHGIPGQSPKEIAERVYLHVVERLDRGEYTGRNNQSDYGTSAVAYALGLDHRDIERAMKVCAASGWLSYQAKDNNHPAGWRRGSSTPLIRPVEETNVDY